jgi:ABC-2 type transport system permease protein
MARHTLAIAWKELQVLFSDKATLVVYFLMPLLVASIMGGPSALAAKTGNEETGKEPAIMLEVYVVNEDAGPYGTQVAVALDEVPVLDIDKLDSTQEADRLVAAGERLAAIVIPGDFTAKIEANEPTKIQVLSDRTQDEAASVITGIVNQAATEIDILGELRYGIRAVMSATGALDGASAEMQEAMEAQTLGVIWTQVQELRQNPLIVIKSQDMAGEEAEGGGGNIGFYIPAWTVMFAFFLIVSIGESLLKEKEQGSFRRLMAAPINPASIIAGFMLAYSLVVFLQVILLFGTGAVVFGMPLGNSPLGLFLTTLAVALAASNLGLLIGAVARTSGQANNIGMAIGFVLMILGGCVIPLFNAEGVVGLISNLTPHAHAIQAYQGIMSFGYSLLEAMPHILVLFGFAIVFFLLALWRFEFE